MPDCDTTADPSTVATADLVATASELVPATGRRLLGIAGSPGAGKTTLARLLVDRLRERHGFEAVAWAPMDGFHLADRQLARLGLLEVKGAPETFDVDGFAAALRRLRERAAGPVYLPGFERDLEQPIAAALAVPAAARLVVTEGNYLLLSSGGWPQVRELLDEVWFITGNDDERVRRLVARHVRFGKSPEAADAWVRRTDEANARLIAPTIDCADRVVDAAAEFTLVR